MSAGNEVVADIDAAAQSSGEAERVEPGAGDQFGLDALAAIVVGEVEGGGEAGGDAVEDGVVVAEIPIHRIGEAVLAPDASRSADPGW